NPYEEAKAVRAMLDRGLTDDGAAQALGWPKQRVSARVKILELPERAQQLLGGVRGARRRLASGPRRHPHRAALSEGHRGARRCMPAPRARMRATLGRASACATAAPTTLRAALASPRPRRAWAAV